MTPDKGLILFLLGMPPACFAAASAGHTGAALCFLTTTSWVYVTYTAFWS